MNNFREVNDDILRDWLSFREEMVLGTLTKEDRKHYIYFDEIAENILKNVPKQNHRADHMIGVKLRAFSRGMRT